MMGIPDFQFSEFDRGLAAEIIRAADFAVGMEVTKPGPPSRIRNPDGSIQGETPAEFSHRLTETAVLYLLETGLLVIPRDIETRLERPLPIKRMT
jgi:hypothetical protein